MSKVNARTARAPLRQLACCAAGLGVGLTLMMLSHAQAPAGAVAAAPPLVSIKELMEKTLTPATNTLWNAYEPPSDEQWPLLEEAAVTLLVAASVNAQGGTGPMDTAWVKDPRWQAFNQVMIAAGRDALTAIRARDHDALLAAGDVLYPPCEGCHLQFNPAVIAEHE